MLMTLYPFCFLGVDTHATVEEKADTRGLGLRGTPELCVILEVLLQIYISPK